MRNVNTIFIHCSSGFGLIPSIEKFWYSPKSKGGLGWNNPGYHIIIYEDGTVWYVTKDKSYSTDRSEWYPQLVTNGVGGHNSNSIHICYIGGVERGNTKKAVDSRTPSQKWQLEVQIQEVLSFLIKHQSIDSVRILGHRDISPDKNGNGVIEPWERIKECPSFEVGSQYDPIKDLVKKRYNLEN
jgi:N-acetylmuramoyl-L-alanine amidase